jgi:hypothetical protein
LQQEARAVLAQLGDRARVLPPPGLVLDRRDHRHGQLAHGAQQLAEGVVGIGVGELVEVVDDDAHATFEARGDVVQLAQQRRRVVDATGHLGPERSMDERRRAHVDVEQSNVGRGR